MPKEKLINWVKWIIEEALIKLSASNSIAANKKTDTDDLVAILRRYLGRDEKIGKLLVARQGIGG